ncbi:MAG: uroporphyrinogen decarboxylase family protein [Dehalococcoidia bacterium]
MGKSPQQLYGERLKRVEDAIELKVPDRVPVIINPGFFATKHAGITGEDAFYDLGKWGAAIRKTLSDLGPDMYYLSDMLPGKVLEALDCLQLRWPGHGVPPNHTHQFVEGEYMEADEYDAFLDDPSDYAIRTYLPRVFGALEPLNKLPALRSMLFGYSRAALTVALTQPEVVEAFDALSRAGHEMLKWRPVMSSLYGDIADLGFPSFGQARAASPFDTVSDYLRGMRGSMLDMYRQPDKLLEACEKILPWAIEGGVSGARKSGNPRVFMALHRGADGFMSSKQFETFYWPTLKRLILALVDQGLTPFVFFEGDYTSRLEYLLELPKGKVLGHFDTTDIFRAKEVLHGHMCIRGNVPSSLLQTGSPQDVKDYCRELIDVVGRGGGFILSPRSSIDEAKLENLKAMFDFTGEYGVYS